MNKKFSTLMAGGFLLTSVFASAQVTPATLGGQELKEVEFSGDVTKGTYFIVQESDGNNELSAGDQILSVTKSGDVLTYSAPYFQYATLDESAYLWTLEVTQDGNVSPKYFYALKNNETGTYLTFPKTGGAVEAITDATACTKGENGSTNTSWFVAKDDASIKWTNGSNLFAYGTKQNALDFTSQAKVQLGANPYKVIYLCEYKDEQLADIADMNDKMGGNGFNLTFEGAADYGESNIFKDLNLKAFTVGTNSFNAPEGTYLALADELPVSFLYKSLSHPPQNMLYDINA